MESGLPTESAPPPIDFDAPEADDLVTALNEWLVVLNGVLAREINPEHREKLERGTAELKEIVLGIVNDQGSRRKP